LCGCLRANDVLARLDGDEFAVLVGGSRSVGIEVGQRLLDALADPLVVDDQALVVSASAGIATSEATAVVDADTLLRNAGFALHSAKAGARGRLVVYEDGMSRAWRERAQLAEQLRSARAAGQLEVHYQATVRLPDGVTTGYEALVRWRHPRRGLLGPSEFLPLMEQSGLTRMLTAFVLERAFTEIGELRRRGFDLEVAANLGPADLLDLGLPSEVERLLERTGLAPEHVELEVSEDVVMADVERTMDVLVGLRATGVRTALDDFGAGHAALRHVKQLQVDTLKVDRSFVLRCVDDERDAAIVHSLVDLGRRLGVRVVAEGVESAAAWERLAQWRCDEAQGYYVGRPMPVAELAEWLVVSAARDR
jgi:predicted signal transduction protein with EAL and GGDEF domain